MDPLDGTAEYTAGMLDHVTVLIGIAYKNRAVGGVVHQPYYNYQSNSGTLGRTLWGIPGLGVGGFQPVPPPKDKKVVVTTRSHMTPVVQQALDELKPDEVRRVGGAGFKVLLVMEGEATAYVFASPGCNKWDTCAPEGEPVLSSSSLPVSSQRYFFLIPAILTAMGGRLTDIAGNPYPYGADAEHRNRRGVLAAGRVADHQWFVERIPEAVKQSLK